MEENVMVVEGGIWNIPVLHDLITKMANNKTLTLIIKEDHKSSCEEGDVVVFNLTRPSEVEAITDCKLSKSELERYWNINGKPYIFVVTALGVMDGYLYYKEMDQIKRVALAVLQAETFHKVFGIKF